MLLLCCCSALVLVLLVLVLILVLLPVPPPLLQLKCCCCCLTGLAAACHRGLWQSFAKSLLGSEDDFHIPQATLHNDADGQRRHQPQQQLLQHTGDP